MTTAEQVDIRRRGRQRLIGAVVIALLAVVFVPMVLDPEPRRERAEPSLAIPSRDAAPPVLAPAPATRPADATPAPAPESSPAKTTEPKERRTVEPRSAELKSAAPRGTEAKAQPRAAPKLEGFAVQVGAFREEKSLAQARAKLAAAGLPHFTDRQPDFTRLRAGPFPTREAAEKAAAKVKQAGLDGQVVPLP